MIKIVLLAGLICLDVWLLLSRPKKKNNISYDHTLTMPAIYLDQLNPKSHRCIRIHSLSKGRLNTTGMMISRAGDNAQGDVQLECHFEETHYVSSTNHAVVVMDEHGFFIQCNPKYEMFLMLEDGTLMPKQEIDIQGGEIIYLGRQPIRFRMPERRVHVGGPIKTTKKMAKWIQGSVRGFSNDKNGHGGSW